MRLIPPIAVPVSPAEVAASVMHARQATVAAFAQRLAAHCGAARADLFRSGRAALSAYLSRVAEPGRDEVIVPAYTCWSVPSAVVRAGLRIRMVDVDPATFDFAASSLQAAAGTRTLCVLATHLFARSADLARARALVAGAGATVPIVEDAAQAWPRPRSPHADAVLLSFGRGKPLALGGGGALLHDGDGFANGAGNAGGWVSAAALAATAWLAHPRWFRIPSALPFLAIGETRFEPRFPTGTAFFPWQADLGLRLLDELAEHARRRSENAARVLAAAGDGRWRWDVPAPARQEGPLRLPLLAPDRAVRDRALHVLRTLGVAASGMYPGTLAEVPELRAHLVNPSEPMPGAERIARTLLTLPVYPHLPEADVARIAAALRAVMDES